MISFLIKLKGKRMKQFTIIGKVVFEPLEGGFWGIEDERGGQWLPIDFPSGLKKTGLRVQVIARERDDVVSFLMWGTPVRILSYRVLP